MNLFVILTFLKGGQFTIFDTQLCHPRMSVIASQLVIKMISLALAGVA